MVWLGACLALLRSVLRPGEDLSMIGVDDVQAQNAAVATPLLKTMAVYSTGLAANLRDSR